jgi:hypothetical protein
MRVPPNPDASTFTGCERDLTGQFDVALAITNHDAQCAIDVRMLFKPIEYKARSRLSTTTGSRLEVRASPHRVDHYAVCREFAPEVLMDGLQVIGAH